MASRDDAPEGAQIAASVIAGMRHLLLETGVWEDVRTTLVARHAGAIEWIETDLSVDPTKVEWVSATHYGHLLDAMLEVLGEHELFAVGRTRLHRTAQAGAFAPVVRSWVRSFGGDPQEFLRLTIHAWATQTRGFGSIEAQASELGRARFVLRDAVDVLRQSAGWRQFLAGYGSGLLDLIHCRGTCTVRPDATGRHLEIAFDYERLPGTPASG